MTEQNKELTINDVQLEWENDSTIDESILNEEICRTASLHSKYIRYFIKFSKDYITSKKNYENMASLKRKYYKGECTQAQLVAMNWHQFQGNAVTGVADMNSHLEYDRDLIKLRETERQSELSVKVIENILKSISFRDSSLRTLYEYNKYLSGA